MTLTQYLTEKSLTEAAFARQLGVSQVTVNRYVNHKRFPDRDTILRIEELTQGAVAPADWYSPAEAAE